MAVSTMRVPTVFTAVDRFSNVVSKMTSGVTNFSNSTASAISRVDHRMNGMFRSMNNFSQLALGGGTSLLFYNAGRDIMEYETKIASLAAVTGTKVGAMNKQIESLGNSTGRSVIDIAGAFEIVGSKMSEYLDKPEALKKITDGSILLANASRMELEPAIESLTQLMNIYKMTANDTGRIVNKLSAGETVGSISIAQSGDILRQFGAQAVSTNAKLEESIALIQTLTKPLGVEGVGRNLRNILFDISSTKTWDKNRWKAIKMAGVDFEFVTNKANNLTDRLRELKKLAGTEGATELFFKRTGTVGAKTLFQNFETYENFLDKINKLNDAEAKAIKNTGTLSNQIGRLKDSFTNFMVTGQETNTALSIVKDLIVFITKNMGLLINTIGILIGAFITWKALVLLATIRLTALNVALGISALRGTIATAALTGNATALGIYTAGTWLATTATTALSSAFTFLTGPIGLTIGALGLLGYAIYETSDAVVYASSRDAKALEEKNKAWRNSTSVQMQELEKQKKLLDAQKPNLKGLTGSAFDTASAKWFAIERQKDSLTAIAMKNELLAKRAGGASFISRNNGSFANASNVNPFASRFAPINPISKLDKISGMSRDELVKPENLSGRMQPSYNDVLKLIQSQDKEIKITTNDPSGVISNVEAFGFGVPVKTTSTTGQATGR